MHRIILLILIPILIPGCVETLSQRGFFIRGTDERSYRGWDPPGDHADVPMVVVLHDKGSSPRRIERRSGFTELAH